MIDEQQAYFESCIDQPLKTKVMKVLSHLRASKDIFGGMLESRINSAMNLRDGARFTLRSPTAPAGHPLPDDNAFIDFDYCAGPTSNPLQKISALSSYAPMSANELAMRGNPSPRSSNESANGLLPPL
jgi:hypothetical protein